MFEGQEGSDGGDGACLSYILRVIILSSYQDDIDLSRMLR